MTAEAVRDFNSGTGLVGVGIAGMRERTRVMKGRFLIRSGQDGTTIEVSLPLSENNKRAYGSLFKDLKTLIGTMRPRRHKKYTDI